jgi:hypothetical protein
MDNEPFPPAVFFGAGWKLTFDHKPEFGGVSGGRSVVKTATASAFHSGVPTGGTATHRDGCAVLRSRH